jgi:hypothetical protein
MTIIPVSTLEWYKQDYVKAREAGDEERMRLFEYLHKGLTTLRDDPKSLNGVRYLEQGRELAVTLDTPCWELEFDYWVYASKLIDGNIAALPKAIELFTKANKHRYYPCPPVGAIYANLIWQYLVYDPVGYEEKIREAIEHFLNELDVYQEDYDKVVWRRIQFEFFVGNYSRVVDLFPDMLKLALIKTEWLVELHLIMAETYYRRKEMRLAMQYAKESAALSRKHNDKPGLVAALKWQITISSYTDTQHKDWRWRWQLQDEIKLLGKNIGKRYPSEFYADEADMHRSLGWIGHSVRALTWYAQLLHARIDREPYFYALSRRNLLQATLQTPPIIRWWLRQRYGMPTIEEQLKEVRVAAQVLAKPEQFIAEVERMVKRLRR